MDRLFKDQGREGKRNIWVYYGSIIGPGSKRKENWTTQRVQNQVREGRPKESKQKQIV